MAESGYILEKYSALGIYTFRKAEPEDLHYKIDYRSFKNKKEFEQYKTFFEDAGWEHVCGTTYSGGQYFIPKSSNEKNSDIFSDIESKAARYKRFIGQCVYGLALMLVYILVVLSSSGFDFTFSSFGYLTPGLWEKTGSAFWRAFLFETPFVILRFLPLVILLTLTIMHGYWAFIAQRLYKKSIKDNKNCGL
jgi:hypothetical protein